MKIFRASLSALVLLTTIFGVHASSIIPFTTEENIQFSDAVFRGTVTAMSCFKDENGLIFTRTSLRVDEPLKGKFPAVVQVVHRGGQVGNEDDFSGFSPRFQLNGEYLLFVKRGSDGRLFCIQGSSSAVRLQRAQNQFNANNSSAAEFTSSNQTLLDAVRNLTQDGQIPGMDVTDQTGQSGAMSLATTGMLGDINSRFLQPDRGEPIPYLIDADSLPVGITLAQATNAVKQALNAWAAFTSLKFQFEGFQSFGQGADTITNKDQKLRIQLHDNYNRITNANVLGIGGRSAFTSPLPGTGWEIGGNVAGNEFRMTRNGYVVLESTNAAMQNSLTLAEVLCHEIGHALNMAHSSEIVTNVALLTNSIMYFQSHADGRGATLGAYDPPVIQQAYPSNTVPYSYDRVMDIITAPSTPSVAGINEIELRGYDLQSTNLTFVLTNENLFAGGSFSVAGKILAFTPPGFTSGSRADPAGNGFYDLIYTRFSDGTNASPYNLIRVVSFYPDSFSPSDGIPDAWMTAFFGNANPAVGSNHKATNDFDGDGLNNLKEYIAGSIPTNAASAQRITIVSPGTIQWQAKAYELFEIQSTTNLASPNWTRFGNPVVPTNAPFSVRTNLLAAPITATVTNLPMTNTQMFFRIQKVP